MAFRKLPDGSYVAVIGPSLARDLAQMPTFDEMVAWAIGEGGAPPTRAEYDKMIEEATNLKGQPGTFRGMTIIDG